MDTRKATQDYRRQIWTELIRGRQGSGLTVIEYCAQNGIRNNQYYYWLHKLRMLACKTVQIQNTQIVPGLVETLSDCMIAETSVMVHIEVAFVEVRDATPEALLQCTFYILLEAAGS